MREHDEQLLRRGFELWNRGEYESLTEIFDIWEEWSIEPTLFLWNGNRALIETRVTARGKGSGIGLAETYYSIWTVEEGKGTTMELHVDRDAAYESAGLSAHLSAGRDT